MRRLFAKLLTRSTRSMAFRPFASFSDSSFGNFETVKRFQLNFTDVEVSRWRSKVSGLNVVHVNYEAPLVNGYFAIGTEIFNDSGCPHTLEHLVFMGSEKYPYKGIIDHLANRAFSNGTNAWTDVDHTVYTISTAGSDGFLRMLPYYVDHILYPTLTQSSFLTEVHHINGKGHNSGVVYSEMQGRQNTSDDLLNLQLQRLMNNKESAYRSETGGLMEALRKLTIDQIRDYHSTYYVPHNLSIIVMGSLKGGSQSLLSVIQNEIEPSLIAHGQNKGPRPAGWVRPFLETPSAVKLPLEESLESTVLFPEKDESVGELIIGYRGPKPDDFLERKGLDILGSYLTSSSVAPLNKEFIEIEQPLCSYIYFGEDVRATSVDLPVYIGSIPAEHLGSIETMLLRSFRQLTESGFDMTRMRMVIRRDKRQFQSKLESSKGDTFSTSIITDVLYGPEDGSEMKAALDEMSLYEILESWTSDKWVSLLKRYYVDSPSVVIRGKPSADLAQNLDSDEKGRIVKQIESLGPEGLANAERELEAAKAKHEEPIPEEILKSFRVPDVGDISWIEVQSVRDGRMNDSTNSKTRTVSHPLEEHLNKSGLPSNLFLQYDHVQSDFVTVQCFISLEKLENSLRPLLSAYVSSFFELPNRRAANVVLSHEEVVNTLDEQTVSYDAGFGISSYFPELLRISIKVQVEMYENAVVWLKDLLYGSIFDKERILVTLAKIQQSLPELKRDGHTVVTSASSDLLFGDNSSSRANNVLSQLEHAPRLLKRLQDDPETVVNDFEKIRKTIVDLTQMRFSVSGNIMALNKPRDIWNEHFPVLNSVGSNDMEQCLEIINTEQKALRPVPLSCATLSSIGSNPMGKAVIMGLSTVESSFTIHTTRGISGFDHPEYPVLRVACEILNATESFLWRSIRGSGLAYGASVSLDIEAGLIHFSLYRSSDSTQAFKEATKVVRGLVDGSIPLSDISLDAAKSSIVYSIAKGVSTSSRAATASFVNQALKNVKRDFRTEQLEKIQAVTTEDILSALERSFLPLFDAKSSVAVIVTALNRTETLANDMKNLSFDVEHRELDADFGWTGEQVDEASGEDTDGDGSSTDDGKSL